MNVYIVEDELFSLEDLKITLEEISMNCLGYSQDAFAAYTEIEKLKDSIDVALIDIHLNGHRSGVDLARKIKENFSIPIIFTTSETDPATILSATEIGPIAYLSKPIKQAELIAAIELSKNKTSKDTPQTKDNILFVKSRGELVRLEQNEILFIQSDTKNYTTIVLESEKKHTLRNSISALKKELSASEFIQTHRGFLVRLNKISAYNESDQTLTVSNHSIPVGRSFKTDLLKRMKIL